MNLICYNTLRDYCRTGFGSVLLYGLLLLTVLPFKVLGEGIRYHALNVAEVNLLPDSTDASSWTDYGWALWRQGDPKADWTFKRALHIDPGCHEARRGLAAMASAREDYDIAFSHLGICEPSDTLCLVIRLSLLQQTGNLLESEETLNRIEYSESSLYSGLFNLLEARQSRLTGDSDRALQCLNNALDAAESNGLRQVIRLEHILLGDTGQMMSSEEIIEALRFDLIYLGGVYKSTCLSHIDSADIPDPVLPARILQATGDLEAAYELLPEHISPTVPLEDRLWVAELLLRLDRMDSAMELVDAVLRADSSVTDAWRLKGLLLIWSYQYYEAFDIMQIALVKTGGAYECRVVAGLAAELAGESKLSVECYAPILAASSDSVVLINRERELVLDEDLNYNFNYEERNCFSSTERSWLGGGLRITYSGTTGEVEQSQLGINANAFHTYGLYGSAISANVSYSLQKWPGSSGMQEICSSSIYLLHRNTSRYYWTLGLSWEQRRYDVNRWKLEASAGAGRWFQLITPLTIELDAGIGRTINKWDAEGDYEANWIALTSLTAKLKGQMFANYLPALSASVDFEQQLDNLSRYDVYGSIQVDYYTSSFLSFGVGYSIEYLSAIPPEYEDILNGTTFVQMGLSL